MTLPPPEARQIVHTCVEAGMNISPGLLERLAAAQEPLAHVKRLLKTVLTRGGALPPVLDETTVKDGAASLGQVAGEQEGASNLAASPTLATAPPPAPPAATPPMSPTPTPRTGAAPVPTTVQAPAPSPPASPAPPASGGRVKLASRPPGASGPSRFKAYARDVDADFRVLTDPSDNLFTEGEFTDFLNLFQTRFEMMREIFRQRGDTGDALPLNEINAMESSQEDVKTIGMVTSIRQSRNQNYLVELEDQTGRLLTVVTKKMADLYALSPHILEDQVLCVTGFLSVNDTEQRKSRILIVNDLLWPDVPSGFSRTRVPAEERVSVALLSDMHFGSDMHLPQLWDRFVDFLNGRIGSARQREIAGSIKYVVIAGDLVDGVGIYPNQDQELTIPDIHDQFQYAEDQLARLPEYVKLFFIPGNHEPVRNALPQPAVPERFSRGLRENLDVTCAGSPSLVSLHGIKVLAYHGESLIDLSMTIPGLTTDDPVPIMKELLRGRHLAPTFGKKTEIAPAPCDHLVVNYVPDILHVGHTHINGYGAYRGVLLVNSGCFQAQTSYMKSFGIVPTPGKIPVTPLYDASLRSTIVDLAQM